MKILLIAGSEYAFITEYLLKDRKSVVVNTDVLILSGAAEYLREHPSPIDHIVVTDDGLSMSPDDNIHDIEALREIVYADITIVTRDFLFDADQNGVNLVQTRWYRSVESDFKSIFDSGAGGRAFARQSRDIGGASRLPKDKPAQKKAAQKNAALQSAAQQNAVQQNAVQQNAAQHKTAQQKTAQQKTAQKNAAQQNTAQQNAAQQKTAQQKAAQRKVAERLEKRSVDKIRKWGPKRKTEEECDRSPVSAVASKAILFTGHRGSGVTSTTVNVAITASLRGVNTMIVDLDTDYRSTNLYFGEFYKQAEKDDFIASSLIRTLSQPQSYQTAAVNIDANLWLTTLGYGFSESKLIAQHFTESKIIGLVTALKHSFNLISIDLPLDVLARFPSLINSIDVFALCIENNIYSAITTLRNISMGFPEQERIAYLASKSKLVVTKYNDESIYADDIITPERLGELIVSEEMLEDFDTEIPVAGSVPYISWFGKQIEDDIPVMYMDSQMQQAYDDILLRLMG